MYLMIHENSSSYMGHDVFMKGTSHFRTTLGTMSCNFQVFLFGFHVFHYADDSFSIMEFNFIKPFTLQSGDRKNNKTNDNTPYSYLKCCTTSKVLVDREVPKFKI